MVGGEQSPDPARRVRRVRQERNADRASRRLYGAVRSEAERRGFGWAYWQFEGDFVVWDMAKQQWVEPIRKALIP